MRPASEQKEGFDGTLDPERKRMFMAMKREVLRLGGYEQEYFISQTPELLSLIHISEPTRPY